MTKRKYLHFIIDYDDNEICETDSWKDAFGSFFSDNEVIGVWGLPNNPNACCYETILWKD